MTDEPLRFIRRIKPGTDECPAVCAVCNDRLTTAIHAYYYAAGPDVSVVTHPLCGPAPDPHAVHCPTCWTRLTRRRRYDPLHQRWDDRVVPCPVCDGSDAA